MSIIIIGSDVADDVKICYLSVLGDLSVMDKKIRVRSLNVSDSLEEASNFF